MKLEIPKIVKTVAMSEYAPEFGTEKLAVWVNPPVRLLDRWDELGTTDERRLADDADAQDTERRRERRKILSELWSQGSDAESHWSVEEVEELERHAMESDPGLLLWMARKTFEAVFLHRLQIKKN